MSTPQSVIHIINAKNLDNTYQHSIYWDKATHTADDQATYFMNKAVDSFTAYTYLRREWSIKVARTMDIADMQGWNYLMFRNPLPNFPNGGKWYYYFITRYEYINDNCIELFLEMDVIQTWYFELTLQKSMVERETVASDQIGEHTIDEGLEVGELITRFHQTLEMGLGEMDILWTETVGSSNYGKTLDGLYSGLKVKRVTAENYVVLNEYLDSGDVDKVVNIWMYPHSLVAVSSTTDEIGTVSGSKKGSSFTLNPMHNVYSSAGYHAIRNKKMFCYPYQMLCITNNAGTLATFKLERFNGTKKDGDYWFTPEFEMFGAISPDAPVKIAPQNYNCIDGGENYEAGITSAPFPTCAWDADMYKIYMAQNANQLKVQNADTAIKAIGGAVTAVGSALMGNIGGAFGGVVANYSGVMQKLNLMAQQKDLDLQPHQARGAFSTTINFTAGKPTFEAYWKQVAPEYANAIDDFFSMYGYKVNTIKVPSLMNRAFYSYVKTAGCNLIGRFPNDVAVKIKSIFDNGITFWKSTVTTGDYKYMDTNTPIYQ